MKAGNLTKETILDYGITDRGFPDFSIGDTIEVGLKIQEGNKERVQLFAGDVIADKNNGISSTFTVRRIGANGVGVEKILPLYSPTIAHIRLIKQGVIRRAKLYYVRERLGKASRIKEKVLTKEQKAVARAKKANLKAVADKTEKE